uniref:Uncharacterized protein n=1 Tax=Vitis vinifera TaxID=29760 RepID=A5AI82_VITVI|nr:hypothetical protein VITISV_017991 [Vitis vinifera]
MTGIHPSITSHRLNAFSSGQTKNYPELYGQVARSWIHQRSGLSGLVSKCCSGTQKEGKWRVCVDYTNLNNACPKDSFPLSRIDQIVDSTTRQGMLSFLDAFSGYHQIPMSLDDEEKTAFIMPHDLYCYRVMPFRLKNVGATYQRLMTKIFKPLIGHTVEVYIDDIVVKSKTREEHVLHLQEVFHLLRKYGMKLNPSKCAFGVSAGKFQGFMVSQRGIEVSPDQIKAVMETPPPRSKKELQCLTGKLVALRRFIARFIDELRPFFLVIRKAEATGWTDNCQNAFEKIKHYLTQPPILSSPIPKEKLYMYLVVSEWAISAILFRCPSPKEQKPIYYVSRTLADKLCPYFQAHPVVVLTDQPLRNILHKPDLTGRMLQWAIELSEFGIEFQPKLSMKGQVMADFMLEYSRRPIQRKELDEQKWWSLRLEQAIRLGFPASNNEAEYEIILSGLDLALLLSVSKLQVYSDSQLVVRHVQKEYEAKDARMTRYLTKVRDTLQRFPEWTIEKIRQTENGRADALASIAASLHIKETIFLPIHVQANSSVAETSTCKAITASQSDGQEWTNDIIQYLQTGTLPEDPRQAHKIRVQAARFTLIGGHLYKRSFTSPYLRCLSHSEALYVLAELHEGKDVAAYVKKCDKCQRHAPIPHIPSETLKPILGPWPFAQWGMDIVGSFPTAPAQKKFLLVATDYFSKWVEVEAFANIKDKDVIKFVWKNIICRFGIPQTIIADNGPQFDSIAIRNFSEATNKTLITALKKRLEQAKGKWVEELSGVLNLDWADEVRESASIRMADYQQRASAHYNRKVRPRSFKNGTLVLRKVFENTIETGAGKFQANWEGPYIVSKTSESGAYHLQKLDGTPLLRP